MSTINLTFQQIGVKTIIFFFQDILQNSKSTIVETTT